MNKKIYFLIFLFTLAVTNAFAQLTPVTVSGFNKDVIVDGTGSASSSVTASTGFDQVNYAFVAQNYTGSPTCALPMSRTLTSSQTSGLTFQLEDYTLSNCLHLITDNSSGTLTFATPMSANTVYVLGSTGSGSSTADITVTFTDGTTQIFTGNTFADWFNTTGAVNSIGRVNIITGGLECASNGPNLLQIPLTISTANNKKPIESVTIKRTSGTQTSTALGILAISIDYSGVTPTKVSNEFVFPPIAKMAYEKLTDTAWVNSPYAFVNTSIYDSASYWRVEGKAGANICVPGLSCYHQAGTTRNFRYMFSDTGTYLLTLVVRNRSGMDSTSKWIYVGYPTQRPRIKFYLDKQQIGKSEDINCYDLSENGPIGWYWYLNPKCTNCADTNNFSPNSGIQLPILKTKETGKFDVCLKAWNKIGADSVCYPNYIEIVEGFSMCSSTSVNGSANSSGYLYDMGGAYQSYTPSQMNGCSFLIAPCAESLALSIEQFKLRNQDTLIFREGSIGGPVLRKLFGGNILSTLRTVVSNSGRIHVQFVSGSPNLSTTPGDSGFVIKWMSTPATFSSPNAKFTCLDTIYSTQTINYVNSSKTSGYSSYSWDLNGDGIFGDYSLPQNANYTFNTNISLEKNICLQVTNCIGSSTFCKKILVLPISYAPVADFSALRTKGFTSDTFSLIDRSKNGAQNWSWTITPSNVTYVQGTNEKSQNPRFLLTLPGIYSIKLVVKNTSGIDSTEKTSYISVLAYSSSNTDLAMASGNDIGISRVQFADIDLTTALKTPIYDPVSPSKTTTLFRGVKYTINVQRQSGVTPMERKIWIDKNLDADFIDSGETIFSESYSTNPLATTTFMLPIDISTGRTMRLRIGISEGGTLLTADKARSGCFEDYGIIIGNDLVSPTITLKGPSVLRIEKGKSFVDPGVIAIDNLEGDISNRYEVKSSVDSSQVGSYSIKYWVSDLYGNVSDTVSRGIQVEVNQTGPQILITGTDTLNLEVFTSYTDKGAKAFSNLNEDITNRMLTLNNVDTSKIGTYKVIYSVIDEFGFTAEKERIVNVIKTSLPTIETTSETPNLISHQVFTKYNDGESLILKDSYFSTSDLTLTLINGHVQENTPFVYFLEYRLCDPLGNCSGIYPLQVEVKDMIPPVVTLLGPNPLVLDVFTKNTNPWGVEATDNYYNTNSLIYTVKNNVNAKKIGVYTITYSVKDGAGNTTSIERTVNVVDRTAPVVDILGDNPFNLIWQDTFSMQDEVRVSDNYDDVNTLMTMVEKTTTLTIDQISGKFYGGERGWKEITYQVSDLSGNKSAKVIRKVYVDFRSGLTEANTTQLSIYPNPSTGKFTVDAKQTLTGKTEITLYNILGAKVFTDEVNANGTSLDVNAQGLKAGIYLLQVNNNGTTFTQRVTIK